MDIRRTDRFAELGTIAFSSDGKSFATGFEDGTVTLWDIASGDELYSLNGHTDKVRSVVFSADGKILFSGGGDQIKLWNTAGGQELASLSISNVLNLVLSPDGRLILARSSLGMSLWGASP